MAVVVTAVSGDSLGYVWHQQAGQRDERGYYIEATDAEEPGWWAGEGMARMGLADGGRVEREDYDKVYRQVNPLDGSQIGRKPATFATKADHMARLLAAEPHATAERRIELEREAAKATRQTPAYTDTTISFSKSISLLGASIRANARNARVNGDVDGAAYWDAEMARFHGVLQESVRAGVDFAQKWAGVTRSGNHGTRVEGLEPGRYERAELVASVWLQGLSRRGEPQAHAHVQWARMAFTARDGKGRALDTMSLRAQLSSVRAVVSAHVEAGLTRAFGVEWVPRPDGNGNEIRGVTGAEMKLFSSRTQDIEEEARELARVWEARNGRAPTEYELLHIQKRATMRTRDSKEHGAISWDDYAGDWSQTMLERLGERLADIAPRVCGFGSARTADAPEQGPPSPQQQRQAVREAIEVVSSKHSTWTRADLMRTLQTVLPPQTASMDPDLAVMLLDELTDEAIERSGAVVSMDAPQWPPVPEALRRELDGKSVYTRPGVTRYASRASLGLEEQLVADAQRQASPHLTREQASHLLGADADRLDAVLRTRGADAWDRLASGLRMDQGAAVAHVLSSPRVAEVLVGPAGTGKTRSAAEAARAWLARGGKVIGTATSQNATNELSKAGFARAWNTTKLTENLDKIEPGTLIWVDEGSMVSMTHLARIIAHAAANGCKVVISGDQQQLAAVERGGGMMLLAIRMGYVQLATPQRFAATWEQDASLQLRDGHAAAIDTYQQQGRIYGGDPEEIMRDASRAYVAEYAAGHDVIMTAQSWDRARELSRRVRGDLKHLGYVSKGRSAELSDGQECSAGDLILGRRNHHDADAGEADRGQANGDVMVVQKVTDDGLIVRRVTGVDHETGERRLSAPYRYTDLANADLAYCKTGHSAQGSTHHTGIAVVTGTESRQWLYSAMTRGVHRNLAYTICRPPRADLDPVPDRAAELDRVKAEERFRAGLADETEPVQEREAVAVLSDVVVRDGTQLAAMEMRLRNISSADHLGALNVVWEDLTRAARDNRYEAMLRAELPAEFDGAELKATARWLWRTVEQAEAAGLDPQEAIRSAVQSRPLAGARDVAAVVDARIRQHLGPMVPQAPRSWSARTPELADVELSRYVQELAAAMDAREVRLGEHVTAQQPAWLVNALGPVPADPVARIDYEHRAARIASYRELYGHDHPEEAIGPEPTMDATPDKRARWQAAAMARAKVDAVDLRERSSASLWHMRRSYERITAGAPEHPGRALQEIRMQRMDAERSAVRAEAEAVAARERGDMEAAERHDARGRVCRQAQELHAEHEDVFARQADVRERWSRLTEGSRLLAVAADSELRRRHPEERIEPLRSAEPVITDDERAELSAVDETLASPAVVGRMTSRAAEHEDAVARMESQMMPAEDHELGDEAHAWGSWVQQDRETLLQPPVEMVRPAPEISAEMAD